MSCCSLQDAASSIVNHANVLADLSNQTATLNVTGLGGDNYGNIEVVQLNSGGNAVLSVPACPNLSFIPFKFELSCSVTLTAGAPSVLNVFVYQGTDATGTQVGNPISISGNHTVAETFYGFVTIVWDAVLQCPSILNGSSCGAVKNNLGNIGGSTDGDIPFSVSGIVTPLQTSFQFVIAAQLNYATSGATLSVGTFKLTALPH